MSIPIYSLRPATEKDYDFLYQLHVASMRPSIEATWGWDDAFQEEYFRTHWSGSDRQIVVLDRVDVGTITLEETPTDLFVALIEIHPDHQNKGLGTALLREVISDAHRRRLSVCLHVLKANPNALRLYKRLGFAIIGEREERYVMRRMAKSEENEQMSE